MILGQEKESYELAFNNNRIRLSSSGDVDVLRLLQRQIESVVVEMLSVYSHIHHSVFNGELKREVVANHKRISEALFVWSVIGPGNLRIALGVNASAVSIDVKQEDPNGASPAVRETNLGKLGIRQNAAVNDYLVSALQSLVERAE